MGNFLSDMISLGVQGVFAYASAKQKAEEAAAILLRLTSGKEEVPIDEFLKMYDLRIYDFNSKQADIKFMKNHDFEGAYILHNLSRDIYHVGRSTKVLRKIDRTFRGYENQSVYADWKNQNNFTVRIVRLCDSDFDNTILLERALVKKYGTYPTDAISQNTQKQQKGFWSRLFGK